MKHTVNASVRNKTTRCAHDFSCLETGECGKEPLCKAVADTGCPVLFIEANQNANCPYRTTFGYDQVCLCPTHREIRNLQ